MHLCSYTANFNVHAFINRHVHIMPGLQIMGYKRISYMCNTLCWRIKENLVPQVLCCTVMDAAMSCQMLKLMLQCYQCRQLAICQDIPFPLECSYFFHKNVIWNVSLNVSVHTHNTILHLSYGLITNAKR